MFKSRKQKSEKGIKKRKTGSRTADNRNKNQQASSKTYEILGVVLLAFALISICGLLHYNVGFVGITFAQVLNYGFGIGAWITSVAVLALGIYCILRHRLPDFSLQLIGSIGLFCLCLAGFHHFAVAAGQEILPESLTAGGGLIGGTVLLLLRKMFGITGGIIVIGAAILALLVSVTGWSLAKGVFTTKATAEKGAGIAKEKLVHTYQKIKETSDSVYQKKSEDVSFYDQEKDVKSELNKSAIGEKQAITEREDFSSGTNEEINNFSNNNDADQLSHVKKTKLPRVTNLHSVIEPPDWGNGDVLHKTQNVMVSGDNDDNKEIISNVNEAVPEEVSFQNSFDVKEEEQEMPLQENMLEVSGEKMLEIASPDTQDELTINEADSKPQFTIQYSRADENIALPQTETDDAIINNQQLANEEETDLIEDIALSKDAYSQQDKDKLPQSDAFTDIREVSSDSGESNTGDIPKAYILPQIQDILHPAVKQAHAELELEIAENAEILAKTLENFKVKATIINACHGPAVTRYELEPAPGVKVSKITHLAEDLALALAAVAVRIVPIPGKAAIGIEVPNKELEGVHLSEVLSSKDFINAKSPLTVGLGMDISGQAITADLAKMPHLLVAGATGSGKSVCVNTLITSILFKARPEEVKFILIDPKMVELSNYNGIPHLMVPVVTDMRKAASVLNWAVQEMEKRYALFAAAGARDMARYNSMRGADEESMPAVVIIIDELADLMMVSPHDVEDAICRLAQKARAAGIHLVLATQRPSVDVITGTIKSNIPSRISFAVSSYVDSRTILDTGGAEMLLGKGDMLFSPMGSSKPQRVQGAFISDDEVEALLDFIRSQGQETEPDQSVLSFTENVGTDDTGNNIEKCDELFPKAVDFAITTGNAATSSLQRKFHIGYGRAGALIDKMEELKIVGPRNGTKPREILVTAEEARKIIGG